MLSALYQRDAKKVATLKEDNLSKNKNRSKLLWLIPAVMVAGLLYILFSTNTNPAKESKGTVQTVTIPEVNKRNYQFSPKKINVNPNSVFGEKIKSYPPIWQDLFSEYCDSDLMDKLDACKTLEEAVIVTTQDINPDFNPEELDTWLKQCISEITRNPWQGVHFKDMVPIDKLSVLGSYLVGSRKFKYSEQIGPDNFNIVEVLKNNKGYCATLPVIFTLLAHRFDLPVYLVTAESHVFSRYDDGKERINIESTSPIAMGVGTPDSFYLKDGVTGEDLIHPSLLKGSSLMKNLSLKQSISILLSNSAAALSEKDRFKKGSLLRTPAKTEKGHLNDIKYAASALYFDTSAPLPILNLISIFKRNPEKFGQDHKNSIMSMAMRRGIVQATPEAIATTKKLAENLKREFLSISQDATLLHLERTSMEHRLPKESIDSMRKHLEIKTAAQLNKNLKFLNSNSLLLNKKLEKELEDITIMLSNILKRVDK
jgi:hypothetical protein